MKSFDDLSGCIDNYYFRSLLHAGEQAQVADDASQELDGGIGFGKRVGGANDYEIGKCCHHDGIEAQQHGGRCHDQRLHHRHHAGVRAQPLGELLGSAPRVLETPLHHVVVRQELEIVRGVGEAVEADPAATLARILVRAVSVERAVAADFDVVHPSCARAGTNASNMPVAAANQRDGTRIGKAIT